MKNAGRAFLSSEMALKFYNSIEQICES
jgi:hypothetical protein